MKSPKIRFKEFNSEWNSATLGELGEIVAGGDIDKNKILSKGIYPVYANALTNDGIVGYYNDYFRISAPAVTITGRGEVGYAQARFKNFTPVVRLLSLKTDSNVSFIACSINRKKIAVESTGVPQLTKPTLSNIKIQIPTDLKEQEAIGEFFRKIDEILDLEKLRFKKFDNFKKTMLDKLFVASGENKPHLRLGSFTSTWTSVTLGEVFKERTERSKFGELLSVSISKGVTKFSELNRWDKSSEDKSNYKVVKKGDIAYNSMRMWQGASGMSEYDGIVSPAYTILEPYKNANSLFFSYMFKKDEMLYKFRIKSQGLTSDTWNLKYTNLKNIKTKIPTDLKEQEAIGGFFRKIDEILELSQKRISKLENIKKYLLNKMFV
ncbi:restriction endonuclease subunit S [Campylobacter hyointestinalis]|uniref:restriction endonuclease subunit S n=1 Tax=Campylobacter hyointestinalis TaxID=198 RepID=UPI0011ACEAB2|nr:restriction endonuclease subunit S [Campylobacter hyointestinalis]TWO29525.1 restriction endonuclease subunit S [Campylobacter hyointestinalis]